jgi:tripartite-type tricarboxylate transporter receptor subunit TctC
MIRLNVVQESRADRAAPFTARGQRGRNLAAPNLVEAQGTDWPKGPIKFVVPFPPGGSTDPVARLIQARLLETVGWQIVVENKPGAAGVIGATVVAKAAPDGQTWLVAFDSHILSPAFTSNLPYKDSDLLNVMLVGRAPLAIACHPDRPYKNFADAMADARQRPGKPSVGVLSASQALLLITHLQKENGFDVNVIFYKGGAPTVQDLLAGVTDMALTTLAALEPHVRAGGCGRSPPPVTRARRSRPRRRRSTSRASRAIRPTRGGGSTQPPARRGRSSSA